jgi:hypothetical protein
VIVAPDGTDGAVNDNRTPPSANVAPFKLGLPNGVTFCHAEKSENDVPPSKTASMRYQHDAL